MQKNIQLLQFLFRFDIICYPIGWLFYLLHSLQWTRHCLLKKPKKEYSLKTLEDLLSFL